MKRALALISLMATLVMGQRPQMSALAEETVNLPFSTTSQFILPTTPFTRGSSRRFAFAFAARTTTTVLPQVLQFNPSTIANRASLRFITIPPMKNVTTTTEIPLIDDDTNSVEAAFRREQLPVSITPTTQQPITESRRPTNTTIRPLNQTVPGSLNEKFALKPNQKLIQPLKTINNKTTPLRQINKNPVKIIPDSGNKTANPVHVQTELDPELSELRKRIAAGIAAQKLLRERLKQASASRLQTTNIQKVFTPVRSKLNGVSRRKTAVAPKQSGVKITLADGNAKRRVEGRLRYTGHIHVGRAGSPSPVIAKRFHSDELILVPKKQVQVEPSSVQTERLETNGIGAKRAFSAGPSAVIDDDKNPQDNLRRTTKFETVHGQRDAPSGSIELTSTPAFCRRCYKFWRNLSNANNKSAIYQYCCTIGTNKGELFKKLQKTVTIH